MSETVCCPETSLYLHQIVRRRWPEDVNNQCHHCKKLKSHIVIILVIYIKYEASLKFYILIYGIMLDVSPGVLHLPWGIAHWRGWQVGVLLGATIKMKINSSLKYNYIHLIKLQTPCYLKLQYLRNVSAYIEPPSERQTQGKLCIH